ncbi:hypothetical protein WJX82_007385 [Trebouxia sp. C0006]
MEAWSWGAQTDPALHYKMASQIVKPSVVAALSFVPQEPVPACSQQIPGCPWVQVSCLQTGLFRASHVKRFLPSDADIRQYSGDPNTSRFTTTHLASC